MSFLISQRNIFKRIVSTFFVCAFFVCLQVPVSLAAAGVLKEVSVIGVSESQSNRLKSSLGSQPGTVYSPSVVAADIKKIYKSGQFLDVSAERQDVAGGVKIIFRLVEEKRIGKVTIVGEKKIKRKDILEVVSQREGDLLDPAKIAETKKAIYKLYEEKGYYLADVRSSTESFEEDSVELIFKIIENRSVKIKRIGFVGNSAFSDGKLRKKMKTKEKGFLSFVSGSGKFEDEKLSYDVQMLRYFYQDSGYLQAKVSEPQVSLTRNKEGIYITIPVEEGKKYNVGTVGIEGDILTTSEELLASMKQKSGTVYRKSLEIEDLKKLETLYGDQAYAFAQIVPNITIDESAQIANVTYMIRKGPKVRIDKIIITGNKTTRDKVIRRELRIFENSYFSQSGVDLSKERLYQLGYFETVNVSFPRSDAEDRVNLVIDVKEKSTGTFSVGAGFSTLENFIFTATVQKDNFFGRGWRGGVQANVSKLRQDFIVSMSDQYFLDTRWYLGISAQRYQSALNADFDQRRFGGSVTVGRELFDFLNFRLGYQIDDVSVFNFSSQVPAFFRQNTSGLTSSINASLTYDRRNNRINTTKGWFSTVGIDYADSNLGSQNEYWRLITDHRVFFKLPKNFVFKLRGVMGYINSLNNQPVPLFDRFFLGGINTLRGFDLNSVGPRISVPLTASGGDAFFTYGGNKMVQGNAELSIPIYAPAGFDAVAFFDTGNSYAEDENINLSDLRMNYGFGFRWSSPFGPLRFEWGFPINKRTGESSTVFNFTIGQSF